MARSIIILAALVVLACDALQIQPRAPSHRLRHLSRAAPPRCSKDDAEFSEVDADSADDGPKILMPPTEMLDAMPGEAKSFGEYLVPYAALVLGAFALASGAFALLVLQG